MDQTLPVFSRRQEVELWKSITASFTIPQAERKEKQYGILLQSVRDLPGPVPSPILERMIFLAYDLRAENWMDDVNELVGLQRKGDCRASLAAAACAAKQSQNTAAYAFLDGVSQASDRARFSKAKGDILMSMNNREAAAKAYKDSLRSDPLDTDVYVKMAELDPSINWMAVCAYERMHAHRDYQRPPREPEGADLQLFELYDEFYHGDSNRAVSMLMDHPLFTDPDSYDYRILAARMAMQAGNYKDAREFYQEAKWEVSLVCEAARSYLEGEPDANMALSKFRDAESEDPANPNVVRGLVDTYGMLGKPAEAIGVLRIYLKTEFVPISEFEYAAKKMIELGFVDDAMQTAQQILLNNPDEPYAHIILSKVALEQADFITARQHAKTAMRLSSEDPVAYSQLSSVYAALKVKRLARKYAEKAVALDQDSIEANTALMDVCYEDGDAQSTREVAERILSLDPENVHAHKILQDIMIQMAITSKEDLSLEVEDTQDLVHLVACLEDEGRFQEAEATCLKNGDLHKNPSLLQLLGNAQYAQGKYIQASASFAEAVTFRTDSGVLWHSKGMADERIGDLESAAEAFDRAVVLDQGNSQYWISRGCVRQSLGQDQLAIEAFNRAIELDPGGAYPIVRKASLVSSMGRYDEALAFIQIAEAYVPGDAGLTVAKMKVLNAAGRFSEARSVGEKAIGMDNIPTLVAQTVVADIGLDDPESAQARINKGLVDFPDDPDILRASRDLNVSTENWDEVIRVCLIISNRYPEDRETRLILADAYMKTGKPEEANGIYDELQQAADMPKVDDQSSMFSIARSLLKVDDIVGADRLSKTLIELESKNEDYIRFRVEVLEAARDIRGAEQFLTDYCEAYPKKVFVHELLADLKARKGDTSEAIDCYKDCLVKVDEENPDDEESKRRILIKLAEQQQNMRLNQDAIANYLKAGEKIPLDSRSSRSLAQLYLLDDEKAKAQKVMEQQINSEEDPSSHALLAHIFSAMGDAESVRHEFRAFVKFDNPSESDIMRVMGALNRVGLNDEAEYYRTYLNGIRSSAADVSQNIPPSVKRCAERILRRAYMLDVPIDDPAVRDLSDSDLNDAAVEYLKDIPEYGEIIPWQYGYQRLEDMTLNIVTGSRGGHTLEDLTVEVAFMAGKAKDADEAKQLVSYVRSAKTSRLPDMPENVQDELRKLAAGQAPGESVEQIMKECSCGIFTARMIQLFV